MDGFDDFFERFEDFLDGHFIYDEHGKDLFVSDVINTFFLQKNRLNYYMNEAKNREGFLYICIYFFIHNILFLYNLTSFEIYIHE